MSRAIVVVLIVGAALLALATPAIADGLHVHRVYRSTCDENGSCTTEVRKCLRFHGQRFCTRWKVSGTWVR